jgi:predicted AAA+ superfamily ATPase
MKFEQRSFELHGSSLEIIESAGFSLAEVGAAALDRHWLRGGLPLSFTARTQADSALWRRQFVRTFVERDLPQLGSNVPAEALRRFWTMLAHYHGQVWNAADPARSLGVSEPAVRRYLDLLTGVYMVHRLKPWHQNLGKRQVKSPKVYVRDTGLLHALLGIDTAQELLVHPKSGASWEGYAVEETLKAVQPEEAYFWATHQGAELDLLLFRRGGRFGVEIKRADAPLLTPSMRIALRDLKLEHLTVLYPGSRRYALAERITVVPVAAVAEGPDAIFPRRKAAPPKRRRG